jgi:predicted dehydrogenase
MTSNDEGARRAVRYAVIGAGHIAQTAVLPAFRNAENAELVAIVSGDATKRQALRERYGVERCVGYEDYADLLDEGDIDAVFITLPNHLHCEYAVTAARHGVHVLCEKPMAVTEQECEQMLRAAEDHGVQLMIAYRLHFEPAHLEAISIVKSGEIGTPRLVTSTFSQDVQAGNVRLLPVEKGGGPVYDMGVYCINAARYLLRDEPIEVVAQAVSRDDPRFRDAPETVSASLVFPEARIASFVVSFGASDTSRLAVVGDRGLLVLDPAFEYAKGLRSRLQRADMAREHVFEHHDQFGAEIVYFSECVQRDRRPEPDGLAGLADVHVTRAIHQSASEGRAVKLLPIRQVSRPEPSQAIVRPGIESPESVHASSPSGD